MKSKLLLTISATLMAGILFFACSPEAGPAGPKGIKGETGATGAQGNQGATGATGANGTPGANGSSSVVSMISASGGEVPAGIGSSYPWAIPASVLSKGIESYLILLYIKTGTSAWTLMPGNVSTSTGYQKFALKYVTPTTGDPIITLVRSEGSGVFKFESARIVVIDAKAQGARKAAVDYDNYEAVKLHYNLQD